MTIWAIGDLHLALSVPSKSMEFFGSSWKNYMARIEEHWKECIQPQDLVLIPGDICWAMRLEEALIDLKWIDALPGTKVILKGNHDYWWSSNAKMQKVLPPSIHFIHNNAFSWKEVSIGGSRLWDCPEYNFAPFITVEPNPKEKPKSLEVEDLKIFPRELERLNLSLSQMDPSASLKIAMTHYPPIGADLAPSKASAILEHYKIDICVFGHLHSVKQNSLPFGNARGVRYVFTSCDYLNFKPIKIASL
ncbi:MAG: hypothetical protein RLZZ453_491 [Chlamydiota bacterium]|jgi:predicted phosphohydrolase